MKRYAILLVCAIAAFFSAAPAFSQASAVPVSPIDNAELESNLAPVTFLNYEGPYARIDTRAQIRNIGYELGLAVRNGASVAGASNRYFVYHSVTPPETGKLNADVFGLGADAGVDHIRNLRLIIQGYLEAAYSYSAEDAALLAEFATIYNAVFRGNWQYFNTRYKTPLVTYLSPTPDRAGLSTRFDEWPGQTLMMLPLLTAQPGSLSALDTGSLTSPEVIDEMRQDADRGIDSRKDMVDLQERESAEAADNAAQIREQISEDEWKADQERAQLDEEARRNAEERQSIAEEEARLASEREAGNPDPEAEEALSQRQEAADQAEAETERRAQELARSEEATDALRDQAAQQEALSEQRADNAQDARESIAADQRQLIAGGGQQSGAGQTGVLAIRFSGSSSQGIPVRVEAATGRELQRGALNTVSAPTLVFPGERAFAIAGSDAAATGAIRLIEIDTASLGMKSQGNDNIAQGSPLWLNGANLYALVPASDGAPSAGGVQLARFNLDLVRQAVSTVSVNPQATLLFVSGRLLVQGPDGGVLSLNPNTLE